ncbi:hypothetical protein [Aureivirga sp. CE67]|uniref:hypothetical protein n=1 Tax=Aureivirga sp. CE67 TaxID=1788983 RepID=UPI0018CA024C|nr:hypothetical protein [Aureivirga sp. CE67]
MNINYILTEKYIVINGKEIFIGETINEIENKTNLSLYISQKTEDTIIVSEQDFQLYFKNKMLYMWTISPDKSFLFSNLKKKKLIEIQFNNFLEILFLENIKWEFNKVLTFSGQICVRLENRVDFIFGFDKKNKKVQLSKVGFYSY